MMDCRIRKIEKKNEKMAWNEMSEMRGPNKG